VVATVDFTDRRGPAAMRLSGAISCLLPNAGGSMARGPQQAEESPSVDDGCRAPGPTGARS